jgi:HEAT repeat protein
MNPTLFGISKSPSLSNVSQEKKQSFTSVITYQKTLALDVFVKNNNASSSTFKGFQKENNFISKLLKNINSRVQPSFNGSSIVENTNNSKLREYRHNLSEQLVTELKNLNNKDLSATISLIGKLEVKNAVPNLIELFNNPETKALYGKEIVEALGNFKTLESINILVDIVTDSSNDASLRCNAAKSLKNIHNRRASKPLYDILSNQKEDAKVRASAADALSVFQSLRNNESLISALEDASPAVRVAAASSLGILKEKQASEKLICLLADNNSQVVGAAAEALGKMQETSALPQLVDALQTKNPATIKSIITGLKALNTSSAQALTTIIEKRETSEIHKINAIKAISSLNYVEKETALVSILKNKNEAERVRMATISALTHMKAKNAPAAFEDVLKECASSSIKNMAIKGLALTGNHKNLQSLEQVLNNDYNHETRLLAIKAIRHIAYREPAQVQFDVSVLLQELNSTDNTVKELVLDTLGAVKSAVSSDVLLDYLVNETNPKLKGLAAKSLAQLGEQKAVEPLKNILSSEQDFSLKTQSALSLIQLNQKPALVALLKDNMTEKSVKKAIVSAFISVGDNSKEIKEYLKPGLNVSLLHQLGITGKNIEVAVVDKPVDLTHPEFENRVIIKPLEHGTMVAGNVAGKSTGVAPESIIYSYDAFNEKEIGLAEIIERIVDEKLAGKNDVKIINFSLGYDAKYYKDSDVLAEVRAFKKAASLAHKAGISVVLAAGNEGLDPRVFKDNIGTMNLLAFNPYSIVVGASDTNGTPNDSSDDTRADYSSYPLSKSKRQIDVMAPGSKIELPYPGGLYRVASGTSFSTPFVSGLIALMYEVNPDLDPKTVRNIINSTAEKLKGVPAYKQGNGEVVPYKAIFEAYKLANPAKADQFLKDYESLTQKEAA